MILEQAEFWHWWVAAIVLVIIEILAPGFIMIWLGVAAAFVGLVLLVVPGLTWQFQFLIFAVIAVSSAFGWRAYQRRYPTKTDRPALNRRGERLIGRQLTLKDGIVNGTGVVNVDDTRWKVEGTDLPAGTTVKVTGVEGTVLKVEKA